MTTPVRLLYATALLVLVVAGAVLNARTVLPSAVDRSCADVPADLVAELFPGTDLEDPSPTPRPDGDQLLVVQDGAGDTLLELRCERMDTATARAFLTATEDLAEEPETDEAVRRISVTGELPVRHQVRTGGDLLVQADPESGLKRTWYVLGERDDRTLRELVRRTLSHQREVGTTEAP